MPVRRSLAPTVACLLAGLSGCGGASTTSATRRASGAQATATASSSPSAPPSARLAAHAQYAGFAAAVNFRRGDLPDFLAVPKPLERATRLRLPAFEDESQYSHCLASSSAPTPAYQASSEQFKKGQGLTLEQASSNVTVLADAATTRRQLGAERAALQDPATRRCLRRIFDALGTGGGAVRLQGRRVHVSLGDLRVAPVEVGSATSATEGGYGMSVSLQVTYAFTLRGRSLRYPLALYVDALAFGVGRAAVTLSTLSLGGTFPAQREAQLYSLLVTRAVAASRSYPSIAG